MNLHWILMCLFLNRVKFFRSLIAIIFLTFIVVSHIELIQIRGHSMYPTLTDGSLYLLKKRNIAYIGRITGFRPNLIERGEIWVLKKGKFRSIKRIVGLPNDTLELCKSGIFVNHHLVGIPYKTSPTNQEVIEIIPKEKYFVLGDNIHVSADSRLYGYVDQRNLLGYLFPIKQALYMSEY